MQAHTHRVRRTKLYAAGVAGVLVYYTQQGWLGGLVYYTQQGGWGGLSTIESKPAQSGQTSTPVDQLR